MAKKGEVSLFETQKAKKPTPEALCEQLLSDPALNEGMLRLLALFQELKMKPSWYASNAYNCNYKGKRVVSFGIGRGSRWEQNWLAIKVWTADIDDLNDFLQAQSEEVRAEYMQNIKYCGKCGSCAPGRDMDLLGKPYKDVCVNTDYNVYSPTAEQFQFIEKFILARREYIDKTR